MLKKFQINYQKKFKNVIYQNIGKALFILILGLIATSITAIYTHRNVERHSEAEFKSICNEIKIKIQDRIKAYSLFLQTSSAFMQSSDSVSRNDWKTFNEKTRIDKKLPGMQGLGYAILIPKNQLKNHIQNIINQGYKDYNIRPEGNRDLYTSIIYLEPFIGRNLRAFGFDMFSEPIRRKAMEFSRDSDLVSLSGKVILIQETDTDMQAGALMYVPVYNRNMPDTTVEQRRAAIKGWVYSPYRMNDLMLGILGRWDLNIKSRIHLQIYDDSISIQSLLFDSQKNSKLKQKHVPILQESLQISFNGTKWILSFSKFKDQIFDYEGKLLIVILSGLIISFLLSFLSYTLFNTRYKAQKIAAKLMADLKESESRFKNIFENHSSMMLIMEPETWKIVDANNSASKYYGYSISQLCSMSAKDINTLSPEEIAIEMNKATGEKQNYFIFPHKLSSGELRTVEVHSSPINYSDKNVLFSVIHDITERKKSEERIIQLANEQQIILNTVTTGICYLKNRRIIWANAAIDKIFGYEIGETTNLSTLNLYPDEKSFLEIGNDAYNILSTGSKFTSENLMKKKDGTLFWGDIAGNLINRNKPEDGSIWVINDITERKQKDEELKRWANIFENAEWGILVVSGDGKDLETMNSSFAKMHGYSIGELKGKPIVDIFATESQAEILENIEKTNDLGHFTWESKHVRKDGSIFPVIIDVTSVKNEEGIFLYRVLNVIDISERKKIELELKQSEENYSLFINAVKDFIWILDVDGNIIYVNNYVVNRLGYSRDEITNLNILDLHPAERRSETYNVIMSILDGKLDYCSIPIISKEGNYIPVETRVLNGNWSGKKAIFGISKDISTIRLSEEKFSKAFQNNANLMSISDFETGEYLEVNKAFLNLFQFKREEVIGKTSIELNVFDDETREKIKEQFSESLKINNLELTINVSGKNIYGLFSGDVIYLQDRICLITVMQNITELKLSEQSLKESEEKFRILAENITDVIWILNINQQKFTYISPSVFQLRGYTVEEAMNQSLHESLSPDSVEKVLKSIPLNLKNFIENPSNPKHYVDELQQTCKNGDLVWIETITQFQYSKNGEIEVLGVSRNIAKRKENERALKNKEAEISLLMNSAAEGIYGIDLNGNCTYANRSCIELLGYNTELDLVGKNMHNLIHHSNHHKCSMNIEDCRIYLAFRQGIGTHVDDEVLWRKDGSFFYAEYYSYPQFKENEVVGAVVTFTDISEKRMKEEKLKEYAEELDLKNKDKDRFMSILAHDLKSPFTSLLGFSNLLLKNLHKYDIDKIKSQVSIINQTAHSTYHLLEDLLLWSKSQSGKLPYEPQPVILIEICNEIINVQKIHADSKNISINYFEPEKIMVIADINMLKTILRNLISNAIKFTNKNGQVDIYSEKRDKNIQITVSDNGVGISSENQIKLWNVSQQISTPGTSNEKGTGLGLVLCKEFVDKHGGKIWVESEVGEGSSFIFTIPVPQVKI